MSTLMLSHREELGFAFAFVGGWGGLANALAYLEITDALNRERPPNDQILQFLTSWFELERRMDFGRRYGFLGFKLIREFRSKFPGRKTYWWYWAGLIWALSFWLVGVIFLLA